MGHSIQSSSRPKAHSIHGTILVYLPTNLPYKSTIHVGKYTIHGLYGYYGVLLRLKKVTKQILVHQNVYISIWEKCRYKSGHVINLRICRLLSKWGPTSSKTGYSYNSSSRYNPSYPCVKSFIGVIIPFISSRGLL